MPDDDLSPMFSLDEEVKELFERKIREFARYLAEEWTLTEAEWRRDNLDEGRPAAWLEGYNAALTDGVEGALSLWMDEVYT